ncbi:hypothetical protein ACLKA6_012087 [Drosophila palustris]
MVACFFGKTGHVATVPLEQRRTVNLSGTPIVCLKSSEKSKNKQEKTNILHHDNASSHTSAQTSAFLTGQNVELMGHPPYSPDLAPNDFFLSRNQEKMRGNDLCQKMLLKVQKLFWSRTAVRYGAATAVHFLAPQQNLVQQQPVHFWAAQPPPPPPPQQNLVQQQPEQQSPPLPPPPPPQQPAHFWAPPPQQRWQ